MEKLYGIKEVSRLLQIPGHTIRYWDSEGLIRPKRNSENDYREFTIPCVIEISNVALFRSMDIPVKKIRTLKQQDVLERMDFLVEAEQQIEEKMAELKLQREQIQMQRYFLNEIKRLNRNEYQRSEPVFMEIELFNEEDQVHWRSSIHAPQKSALLIKNDGSGKVQYGVGSVERVQDAVWKRREEKGCYVEFLLIMAAEDEWRNNLEEQLEKILKPGQRPGDVAGQYLASGFKNELLDYYKAWVEVIFTT